MYQVTLDISGSPVDFLWGSQNIQGNFDWYAGLPQSSLVSVKIVSNIILEVDVAISH